MPPTPVVPPRKRELTAFVVLAILIWPFIAVAIVGGWGLMVWIYYSFTGPPGPS
jgi:nitrate reductase NapE